MTKAKTPSKAEQRAKALESEAAPLFPTTKPEDLLSTGCTVLNMALSGTPFGGVAPSTYLYLVGDSGAGKSWLTFCLFAEAARNPKYKKYRFVFDNAENGALMDVERYFGAGVVSRLEAPYTGKHGSTLAQEFYYHVEHNVRRGPCIYVLDSMDALQDLADEDNFDAELNYYETGKGKDKIKGSMGMSKAKTNSRNISRIANSTLRENGSILVVISQTRDKLGSHIPGVKTRGGGHALKFYAHLEAWTKLKGDIKKYHRGKDREIGSYIGIDMRKNRLCGWHGIVPTVEFLAGYGIDDVGTNCSYLLEEKHWKAPKATPAELAKRVSRSTEADAKESDGKVFRADEFDFTGTKEDLVRLIQEQGREAELSELVATVWREISAAVTPVRKARY
jgi:RecA/RadA recombinase